MKPILFFSVFFLTVAVLVNTYAAQGNKKTSSGKSTYMIQAPHTKEECMNVMDAMSKESKALLTKCYWGCMSGDHTAYATVEGKNEEDARKMFPASVRAKAKVMKVDKFTAQQIASFHNH